MSEGAEPASDFLEDLAPNLHGPDVARLLAFLDRMEGASPMLARYSLSRNAQGFAVRVWFREGGLISGHGPSIGDAIQSFATRLIEAGMKGAPAA